MCIRFGSSSNRVCQVGVKDATPIIVKFYRPERWSTEQIREDHHFCQQFADQDLPIVPAIIDEHGESHLIGLQGLKRTLLDPDHVLRLGL